MIYSGIQPRKFHLSPYLDSARDGIISKCGVEPLLIKPLCVAIAAIEPRLSKKNIAPQLLHYHRSIFQNKQTSTPGQRLKDEKQSITMGSKPNSALKVVFGAMTLGDKGLLYSLTKNVHLLIAIPRRHSSSHSYLGGVRRDSRCIPAIWSLRNRHRPSVWRRKF